jgi:hypothetical protein
MIVFHQIIAAAKSNGVRQLEGHAPPWERLTQTDAVVDLIVNSSSPAAQAPARILIRKMSEVEWTLIRGVHSSPSDPTPHVTIDIRGRRYHLRVDASDCIFDITFVAGKQLQRLTGREPWLAPGA